MSFKGDLMDIMDSSDGKKDDLETTPFYNNSLNNVKKQLYNAIGDKIPSLKIKNNTSINKISKPVGKWSYSNRIKHNGLQYKQWIKGTFDENTDIDISYKYNKYNHQYKIPYFASEEIFNKAIEKYRDSHAPELKEALKIEFDKKKELFDLKKEKAKLDKESEIKEKVKKDQITPTKVSNELKRIEKNDADMELDEPHEPNYDLEAKNILDNNLKLLTFTYAQQILELAKDYDLKWIVIQDRFNRDNKAANVTLSVSEIKYIFYKSCTIFFQYNNRSEMNTLLNFDLEKDLARQANLERLFNRSAAEVAEEEALILEAKKFEVTSKKIKEERDSIVKLLDYPKTQPNFIPEQFLSASGFSQLYKSLMKLRSSSSNSYKFSKFPENPWKLQFSKFKSQKQKLDPDLNNDGITKNESENNKKGGDNGKSDYQLNPMFSSLSKRAGNNIAQLNTKNEMIYELLSHLTDFEKDKLHIELHSKLYTQSGISLNSNKLAANKPSVEGKIEKLYQELQIPPKPVMMTSNLIQGYTFLNSVLLECINLKQNIDKIEAEEKIKQAET
ncbi:hypothetical protein QEN19_002422 [Hanseniaspora menglaensis]